MLFRVNSKVHVLNSSIEKTMGIFTTVRHVFQTENYVSLACFNNIRWKVQVNAHSRKVPRLDRYVLVDTFPDLGTMIILRASQPRIENRSPGWKWMEQCAGEHGSVKQKILRGVEIMTNIAPRYYLCCLCGVLNEPASPKGLRKFHRDENDLS